MSRLLRSGLWTGCRRQPVMMRLPRLRGSILEIVYRVDDRRRSAVPGSRLGIWDDGTILLQGSLSLNVESFEDVFCGSCALNACDGIGKFLVLLLCCGFGL